jgi:hypothetical protein
MVRITETVHQSAQTWFVLRMCSSWFIIYYLLSCSSIWKKVYHFKCKFIVAKLLTLRGHALVFLAIRNMFQIRSCVLLKSVFYAMYNSFVQSAIFEKNHEVRYEIYVTWGLQTKTTWPDNFCVDPKYQFSPKSIKEISEMKRAADRLYLHYVFILYTCCNKS